MAAAVAGVETHSPDAPAWHENLNMHLICPDCRQVPPQLVEENADTICANCGMVLAERLVSYESEWRTFNSDEGKGDDPNRVGEADNELYLTNNAGTMIGGGGPNVSKETRRLKKAQAMQLENKAERALQGAYAQIEAWGEKAKLTAPVKAAAKSYYKRVFEANALRVPKKEIGRVYKQLQNFLSKVAQDKITEVESTGGIVNSTAEFRATQSTKPEDLCGRYCNMVGLNFRVQTIAEGLAKKIPTIEGLAGRSPLSNAAACTFFASWLIGFGKPSKQISEVAGVSDATIKHAYRYLLQDKERLVDKEWLGQQPMPLGGFGKLENLPGA
ncbi:transcription initiation factor IIB [Exophiala xenobiotica]|nr:transcription initiation factor IIB [Exophiala xenobiotica]